MGGKFSNSHGPLLPTLHQNYPPPGNKDWIWPLLREHWEWWLVTPLPLNKSPNKSAWKEINGRAMQFREFWSVFCSKSWPIFWVKVGGFLRGLFWDFSSNKIPGSPKIIAKKNRKFSPKTHIFLSRANMNHPKLGPYHFNSWLGFQGCVVFQGFLFQSMETPPRPTWSLNPWRHRHHLREQRCRMGSVLVNTHYIGLI